MNTNTKKRKPYNYKTSANIEYITDLKGKKRKVIIPYDDYESLLEDLHDLSVVAERKSDKVIPYDKVINNLKQNGLL